MNLLLEKKYINKDFILVINNDDLENESLLAKLLYSILWKNGDLGKESHILEGISGKIKEDDKALVFYQFGKYIGDKNKLEPIIDQHTLRSYGVYLCINGQIERIEKILKVDSGYLNLNYYRCLSNSSKNEIPLIEDYKSWIKNHKLYSTNDFVYVLDLLLFSLGKSIKSFKQ